jgi:beta-galactosidase
MKTGHKGIALKRDNSSHRAGVNPPKPRVLFIIALALAFCSLSANGATFVVGEKDFLLDGKPFQIWAGEMHYSRIPREYWPHRLRMAHALGLNTLTVSLFWNLHEPEPGRFDFTGNADIAEFCRLAQAEGLKVIIGPGPYCCAEWDFGGLPWWLLKDPRIIVRTREAHFLEATRRYFQAVAGQLAPLQVTRGGPIIMARVENEYGAYGRDKKYIASLHDYLKEAGFEVPMFTTDQLSSSLKTTLPDMFCAVNFHLAPETTFKAFRAVQPTGPLMCGEWYPGWFDSWGRHSRRSGNIARTANGLEWMLDHNVSFSLYMAHGGTSFGFSSGANSPPFLPTITSYDYGAPISEAGWETPAFQALRQLLVRHLAAGETVPEAPPRNRVITFPAMEFAEVAPLFDNLPEPKEATWPKCMESYDQPHGCILYRTQLPAGSGERLQVNELHDYGLVLVEGRKLGFVEHWLSPGPLTLPARTNAATLDILVEAAGHVNYGEQMQQGRKGITGTVQLLSEAKVIQLTGWQVFNLPLDDKDLNGLHFRKGTTNTPAFYRAKFSLGEVGDTFLDMSTWGKGMVWVNGHNLGRYWSIGPQQTLYCPGPWLKQGKNELIVLELSGAEKHTIAGLAEPVLERVRVAGLATWGL